MVRSVIKPTHQSMQDRGTTHIPRVNMMCETPASSPIMKLWLQYSA